MAFTETGERLTVPKIAGLTQTIEEVNGIHRVVYRAAAENAYGLEAGVFAGYFYPEAYQVTISIEDAQARGAIGLRAEVVRQLLQQAEKPGRNTLFPLPFDVTFAKNPQDTVLFQNSGYNADTIRYNPFLKIPVGSVLTNPFSLEHRRFPEQEIRASWQGWGTSIAIGTSGYLFDGEFTLFINYHSYKVSLDHEPSGALGEPLITIKLKRFTQETINFYNQYRNPKPAPEMNIEMLLYNLHQFTPEGYAEMHSLGSQNILTVNRSFVFILANNNPLLAPTQ